MEKIHGFSNILQFSLFYTDIFIHLILLGLTISFIYYNIAMRKLKNILLLLSILLITVAFNFQHNPPSNWYQQFVPNLNNQALSDIIFLDSFTGFAITGNQTPNDTNYILRTTNGGDNWNIIHRAYRDFFRIKFINSNTGFVCGGFNVSAGTLLKTTNQGDNWVNLNTPGSTWYDDMSVLSEDTIWLVQKSSLDGGVFRTTNGGLNWTQQFNAGSQNPDKIYMFNARIGFISEYSFPPTNDDFRKTTNGGLNWFNVSNDGFQHMYFIDSLTGWKSTGDADSSMKKTTDGGLTWTKQPLLPSSGTVISVISRFTVLNKDTLFGAGGVISYGTNGYRGVIYRTTNGGSNWTYQIPDTSIHITNYTFIQFINKRQGWAYQVSQGGIHTTNGGDTTWLTNVKQISSEIPKDFKLYQNYPNPFNPSTIINYQLTINSFVMLKVFDISGKEVSALVNKKQSAGSYSVEFNGAGLSSGIYFYSLQTEDFKETKKMIFLK